MFGILKIIYFNNLEAISDLFCGSGNVVDILRSTARMMDMTDRQTDVYMTIPFGPDMAKGKRKI